MNGRPIKVIKISNKQSGNKAIWVDGTKLLEPIKSMNINRTITFIVGGIHAREWITPASVTYIINELLSNWEQEPKYIQNIDWYFAPVLNPDGYEYTHTTDRLWRKNRKGSGRCAGIDLNRNFG